MSVHTVTQGSETYTEAALNLINTQGMTHDRAASEGLIYKLFGTWCLTREGHEYLASKKHAHTGRKKTK